MNRRRERGVPYGSGSDFVWRIFGFGQITEEPHQLVQNLVL